MNQNMGSQTGFLACRPCYPFTYGKHWASVIPISKKIPGPRHPNIQTFPNLRCFSNY